MSKKALKHDEVGYWSEIKLDIVKKYASAYSTILAKQNFVKGYLLNWDVLKTAGEMKSIEVFYNFMIMDANVFMKDPSKVTPEQAARMDAVWGDGSRRSAAYLSLLRVTQQYGRSDRQ